MRKEMWKRLLSLALAVVMCASLAMPAAATGTDSGYEVVFEKVDNEAAPKKLSDREFTPAETAPAYKDDEIVRVSIVLEQMSTVAKFDTVEIIGNAAAQAYRAQLQAAQDSMAQTISQVALGGEALDVAWNLTFAANIISANVRYDQIEAIAAVDGVADVVIETKYEPMVVNGAESVSPNMATSSKQIGVNAAYAAGYTGAGSKIAIIDTGLDMDHQSFDAEGFMYALEQDTCTSIDLMTADDLTDAVIAQLNVVDKMPGVTAAQLYRNAKVPFGFNYIDKSLEITHDKDTQGGHGSHVAGIAAANNYIPTADGFEAALSSVMTQGVAPNAQLMIMKVFGKAGGAYDSDYMAAIEDALVMGADSVNLSLGSGNPGMSRNSNAKYQAIMESLVDAGAVVAMSAGNSGHWAEATTYGYLYDDGVGLQMDGSPGSFTNSLAVASVDNDGTTGAFFTVGDYNVFYNEMLVGSTGAAYNNKPIATIAGTQQFVYFDNTGADADGNSLLADYADVIEGKVLFCNRGSSSFFQKAEAAVEAGAIASVICNNQDGVINMDLTDYRYTAPCVSITLNDALAVKAIAEPVKDDAGNILYYAGTMTIGNGVGAVNYNSEYYTMSSFSSWGVPGSLELKPEITAPGGLIYSVDGEIAGGKAYVTMSGTSMAAPQVAGMAALVQQYIRQEGLATGKEARHLAQSLLMSTAVPMIEGDSGSFYSVLNQGAGLADVGAAINAESYITMHANATDSYADGKVKVELGDDPAKTGVYNFGFTINNLTGEEKEYALGADMFTQDLFEGLPGVFFMDTWTRPLAAAVSFVVDGKVLNSTENLTNMDFNGDKVVDVKDCVALLDYTTGKLTALSNEEYADINADDRIDSQDAYLFLQQYNNGVVTLPADGSVNVSVTIDLLENLSNYPVGAYVEGYINIDGMPTAEGALGTAHSIPVLGFYGNWSDASMYDVGGYWEYLTGEDTRAPYLAQVNDINSNMLAVDYVDDDEYVFGGNPYDSDEYIPERAAFNNVNGDAMKWYFTLIRNAAASKITASVNGEILAEKELGQADSAYYYVNGAVWRQTQLSLGINSLLTGAKDGDKVELALTMAPEYYVNDDGSVNWDALGEGATMTESFTIDNTAPELVSAEYDEETKIMTITVKEDQFISVLDVVDSATYELIAELGADPVDAVAGEDRVYEVDMTGVSTDAKLVLYAYDYACNYGAYRMSFVAAGEVPVESVTLNATSLELMKGTSATLSALVEPWEATDTIVWSSSDNTVATVDNNGKVTAVAKGECVITAAASSNPEVKATCDVTVNVVDTTLFGTLEDADGNPVIYSWDLANDDTWTVVAALETDMMSATLNYNDDTLFIMDGAGSAIHKVGMDGKTIASYPNALADFGLSVWDMETSYIYTADVPTMINWIYGTYVFTMDDPTNLQGSGYELGSYLGAHTGASHFVAVTSIGAAQDSNGIYEVILALDNAGCVWQVKAYTSGNASMGVIPTDLGTLSCPGVGEGRTGSMTWAVEDDTLVLYLSYFNGKTNDIYRLEDSEEGFLTTKIGDVGEDVWPATIYSAGANEADSAEAISTLNAMTTWIDAELTATSMFAKTEAVVEEPIEATEPEAEITDPEIESDGSLNSVANYTGAETNSSANKGEEAVVVEVTADEAAPNGKFTVTYDPAALTYVNTVVNADYFSVNASEGKIVFAYAQNDAIAADDVIAKLTFTQIKDEPTTVKVVNDELGDKLPGTVEDLEVKEVTPPAFEGDVIRVFGNTRYQTAFKSADLLKETLGVEKFDAVVVVSGEDFPDALSASYLAAKKNAPILLTRTASMGEVKGYIRENLNPGGTVYIVGGTGVVSAQMESGLDEFEVKRLAGDRRYETNLEVLKEAGVDGEDLLVCTALDFADSLAASAAGKPILLVTDGLLPAQKEFLDSANIGDVYLIGGTGVVNTNVEAQMAAYGTVTRVDGENRFETSVNVAKTFFPDAEVAVLAYAYDYPDGLCGGPLAAALGAPLILAHNGSYSAIAQAYLAGNVETGVVLGGTALISDAYVRTIFGLATDEVITVY